MPRINIPEADFAKLGQLFVKAWTAPKTRLDFITNPVDAMRSEGIDVSQIEAEHVRIVAIEDTLTTRHLVLPEDPRVILGDIDAVADIASDPDKIKALGQGATSGCK